MSVLLGEMIAITAKGDAELIDELTVVSEKIIHEKAVQQAFYHTS